MKISVLTPTYNRANLIGRLYKSLVENSKYNVDIEWIIMDDGSTDDTKEIIKDKVKIDDNVEKIEIIKPNPPVIELPVQPKPKLEIM